MHAITLTKRLALAGAAAALALTSVGASANGHYYTTKYEVTITNITRGQTFTPQLVTTHSRRVELFELGAPASAGLALLAESGDTSGVTQDLLNAGSRVSDVQTIPGLLAPGASISTTVEASFYHRRLSVAAMLIPTNDTFVALDSVRLPIRGSATYTALAYDSGSEANDQNCSNIPGPRCGGTGASPGVNAGDEGYVYVSNGFHELGEQGAVEGEILGPLVYDWRNPVATITIRRIH